MDCDEVPSSSDMANNSLGHPDIKRKKSENDVQIKVKPHSNLLPPCRVCSSEASGIHYGVNTCEACKVSKNGISFQNE